MHGFLIREGMTQPQPSRSYNYRPFFGRRIASRSSTYEIRRLVSASSRRPEWQGKPALLITDGKGREIELYLDVLDHCLDALYDGSAAAPLGEAAVCRLIERSDLPKVPNITRSDTYYGSIASGLFERGIARAG